MNYKQGLYVLQARERAQAATTAKPEQGGAARSALGNATKLRTPQEEFVDSSNVEFVDRDTGELVRQGVLPKNEAINEARNIRFKLQDASRDILFSFHGKNVPVNARGFEVHHRTCTCTRFRTGATSQIVKSKTTGKAFFSGLMSCANSRTCPVCSAKISERKSNEMRVAFNIAKAEKLNVSLLTFTAPHNSGDSLDDLKVSISNSLQKFWRGATATRFKKSYGIVGNIRSFEVRYGSNGWHPHFHIVIFSQSPLPTTKRDANGKIKKNQCPEWLDILSRWKNCCVSSGLSCPNQYGMDIQNGQNASEYITKFGSDDEILQTKSGKIVTWDMADEMTKGNTKTGRKGSLSPWDLLALTIDSEKTDEDKKHGRVLFLAYARAMQGVNLIRWSRGLRDYFMLGKQVSDEEILQQELDKADFLCHISPIEWEYIIKNNLRVVVLQLAENGGAPAVAKLLHQTCKYREFPDYLDEFLSRKDGVLVDAPLLSFSASKALKTGSDLTLSKVKSEFENYLFNQDTDFSKMDVFERAIYMHGN